MTLKELRTATGMTQKQFGEYFGISHRTIQNWEGGQRECPKHLLELMIYKLEKEKKLKQIAKNLPPIIDKETWEAVQAKIRERKQPEQPSVARDHKRRDGLLMVAKIGDNAKERKQPEPPTPYGYKWQDGKSVIDEAHAEKIRAAFKKFVRSGERKNNGAK